jgi:hypothetical protein
LAALGTPNCAIALNAGLGVVTYRWADAIEILSAARTPFIVTDYYEAGLWIGCQLPAVKRSLELTYPITLNPFRQPLVWPEATGRATSMPWMCNGFICGFHTEPSAEAMLHDGVAVEGVTAATGVGAAQESSLVMGVVAASELGVSAGEALAGEKEAQEASGKVAVAGEMTKPQLEPRLAREVLEISSADRSRSLEMLQSGAVVELVLPGAAVIDRSGGRVWRASEELAAWLERYFERCRGQAHGSSASPSPRDFICRSVEIAASPSPARVTSACPCAPFASALELGAGVGYASITLARLGVQRVVCTDGEPALPPLCQSNAARNGVSAEQLQAIEFRWGNAAQMASVLEAVGAGGRCAELIVGSDILYSVDEAGFATLEQTLRDLIARGGCRLVAICWQVRHYNEERFLPRLADLGSVRVAWRSHGLSLEDVCPAQNTAGADAWRAQHSMTWAVGVLEMHGTLV